MLYHTKYQKITGKTLKRSKKYWKMPGKYQESSGKAQKKSEGKVMKIVHKRYIESIKKEHEKSTKVQEAFPSHCLVCSSKN